MQTNYYAVIFTSLQTPQTEGYAEMAQQMETLAAKQPGYIAMEHASDGIYITVSYWETLEAITHWKNNLDHQEAQKLGKLKWYQWYKLRICKVEREYGFERD
jgi:heme-degrading monooxygenase HmoA